MIKIITWGTFLFYLGLIACLYYLFACLYFYNKELKSWLKNPRNRIKKNFQASSAKKEKIAYEIPLGGSYDYGKDF